MNESYDVVVLGTGAAGLVAALAAADAGASVGLFEKADAIGGTTALSGGTTWIPVNPHQAAAGVRDSREEALAYLASLSHGLIDPGLAAALGDGGRGGAGQHARGLVGSRSWRFPATRRSAGRGPGWCCASAPCPGRSW